MKTPRTKKTTSTPRPRTPGTRTAKNLVTKSAANACLELAALKHKAPAAPRVGVKALALLNDRVELLLHAITFAAGLRACIRKEGSRVITESDYDYATLLYLGKWDVMHNISAKKRSETITAPREVVRDIIQNTKLPRGAKHQKDYADAIEACVLVASVVADKILENSVNWWEDTGAPIESSIDKIASGTGYITSVITGYTYSCPSY